MSTETNKQVRYVTSLSQEGRKEERKKERKKERSGQRKTNQKGGGNKERTTSTNSVPFEKFTVAHLVTTYVALRGT